MKRRLLALSLALLILAPSYVHARAYFPIPERQRVLGVSSIDVPVLLYHYVRDVSKADKVGSSLSVSPQSFRRQLTYLLENDYSPITLKQFISALRGGPLPPRPVLFTFDDATGDFAADAFPILRAFGIPATLFVITGFIGTPGYLTWNQFNALSRSPLVTIGSHGLNHVSFTALEQGVAARQIALSRNFLRSTTGQPVEALAFPNGAFSSATLQSAMRAEYSVSFTTQLGRLHSWNDRFKLPRIRAGASVASLERALRTRP